MTNVEQEILDVYHKPLEDLLAPLGYQFTDEFVFPSHEQWYLGQPDLIAIRRNGNHRGPYKKLAEGKRLILRQVSA